MEYRENSPKERAESVFRESFLDTKEKSVSEAQVHFLCQAQYPTSSKNQLLVGDAAGMVLPSNGAGITIAMIGGDAGQVVAEHLSDGTPLEEYEKMEQADGQGDA